MEPLTDTQKAMLDLEQSWWKFAGAKESRIRETFDCSSTIYYQRLNHLIDQPAAEAYAPALVHRLQRLRAARARQRSARRALA